MSNFEIKEDECQIWFETNSHTKVPNPLYMNVCENRTDFWTKYFLKKYCFLTGVVYSADKSNIYD